jgi:uncharacterized phage protein (predicted DNA packaging)
LALLDDVKLALRVSSSALNAEIQDHIDAARADLKVSGVLPALADAGNPDPLIKRAIVTFAKANFGLNNPDFDRLNAAYEKLKGHLTLSQEYTEEGGAA